ncbi:hypothetical protein [Micromonospora sp. WMMD998]|uniref:hypothetical protein n=1 Tax=Micromonospora sp. WMMD998 TaxID=3016092 RepID=UPI00249B4ACF|nr:hypothetical protein [Micromonospora sp. WMMD998]WFE37823.1 hypothetical protein O7619_05020 [Micromonospora sp. WMMD998]
MFRSLAERFAEVIVPLAEYDALKETGHLLRGPSNAAALRRSITEIEQAHDGDR